MRRTTYAPVRGTRSLAVSVNGAVTCEDHPS
jgi:hypothetical protein